MADDQDQTNGQSGEGDAKAKRILTDIAPRSWEHPADKAALEAMRRIPVFDEVLRKLFGFFGEKPVRLHFQANAVKVGPNQFPEIYELYKDALKTLDAPEEYPLYISQTFEANAGAYGMNEPFIVLNSGLLIILKGEQLKYVLGHEIGHVMSDHVLYKTMTYLLLQLAQMGFPIVGLAARVVLVALLEWSRKSELSCDRAGLLAIQDPETVMKGMCNMASGGKDDETNLQEFIIQAEEYRESGDIADQVFKVMNLLGATHPFYTLRVSELRQWIEDGEYDRIIRGEYPRRGEPNDAYQEDLKEAADAYREGAKDFVGTMSDAAKRMGESIMEGFKK